MPRQMTPNSPVRVNAADKRLRALQLRQEGLTYAKIAAELGVSVRRVRQLVDEEFARLLDQKQAVAVDAMEKNLKRLDDLLAAVWDEAMEGETEAVKTALAVIDRTNRMLGLEAPSKQETRMHFAGTLGTADLTEQLKRAGVSVEQLRGPEPPLALEQQPAEAELVPAEGQSGPVGAVPESPE
jgi:predicted transcriptional regulator